MSQTDVVLQGIKAMITGGQLKAGSRLPVEKELTEALGVSRGALREGVRALCIMGVLETRRGDGTFVTSLDSRLLLAPVGFMIDLQPPEHRHHLHTVRRVLESEAAGRAARTITPEQLAEATAVLEGVRRRVFADRITEHDAILQADAAFHHIVARASHNGALAALIDALTDRTFTARRAMGARDGEQIRRAFELHNAILDALKQGDPDRARILMSHHLLTIEDYVREDQAAVDGSLCGSPKEGAMSDD
jgi:GntR family transcriptional regulator, transcriptional repressor for pyruvate dehydrogenase complex